MHSTHDTQACLLTYLLGLVLPIAASCCVPIIEPLRVARSTSLAHFQHDDIPVHHDDEAASAVFLAVQMI